MSQILSTRSGLGPLRWLALAWGLASFPIAAWMYFDLWMVGFPDGGVTPYQQDASASRYGLLFAFLVQGLAAVALGALGRGSRRLVKRLLAAGALVLALSIVVADCSHWRACTSVYEALTRRAIDDGQGG